MKFIYFDIDTLRPDHLSCYGYGRSTPNMDALAADSVLFTNAYASNTPCMPSRASVFTGCFGLTNGVETHGKAALSVDTPPETALARVITWNKAQAVTVSSFGRHPAPWFYNGFSHVIDPSYRSRAENFQRFSGSAVNEAAMEYLDGFKGGDLFLHLHYWDPHGPLTPPPEWIDYGYEPDTSGVSQKQLDGLTGSALYRGGLHANVHDRNDLAELIRRYDAEIRYTDHLIGQMCAYLKERGWYKDSVLVLSADHGEQYGEAQMILEHGTVHDSCIHIPLLLKLPNGERAGTVCTDPVYGLDIAPTAVRALGMKAPENWDGIALQDLLDKKEKPRAYLVCEHGLYTCQRAVLKEGWKLVHTFSPGIWDFPEFALYNTEADRTESTDVKERYPKKLEQMKRLEKEWLEQVLQGAPDRLAQLGAADAQHGMQVAKRITQQIREQNNTLLGRADR